MREYRFRGWSKQLQRMIQPGFYLRNGDNHIFYETEDGDWQEYTPSDITIMQSTGLRDRHGKEIFEGDIVRGSLTIKEKLGKIIYDQGMFMVKALTCDEVNFSHKYHWGVNQNDEWWGKAEIIGNIHEHPELLEGAG